MTDLEKEIIKEKLYKKYLKEVNNKVGQVYTKDGYGIYPLLFTLFIFLFAGCSRYAPPPTTPGKPQSSPTFMNIRLETKENISPQFYYYIAFDTSGDLSKPSPQGPRPVFYGVDAGKNWTYYIRYHAGYFTELQINANTPFNANPSLFPNSPRNAGFPTATGKTISVKLNLSELVAQPNTKIWLNFITTQEEIPTSLDKEIKPLDFLTDNSTMLSVNNIPGEFVNNAQYSAISGYSPPAGFEAADIVAWEIAIYK